MDLHMNWKTRITRKREEFRLRIKYIDKKNKTIRKL